MKKQESIFKDYVNEMYVLRQEYPKSDTMNLIANLLLNSLYGRFGMAPQTVESSFMTGKELTKIASSEGINHALGTGIDCLQGRRTSRASGTDVDYSSTSSR